MEPDLIYFEDCSNMISKSGQVHLYFLIVSWELKRISYKWDRMPLLQVKEITSVQLKEKEYFMEKCKEKVLQLRRLHGNRWSHADCYK